MTINFLDLKNKRYQLAFEIFILTAGGKLTPEIVRLSLIQYVAQGVVSRYAPNAVNTGKVACLDLAALAEGGQRRALEGVESKIAFQDLAHAIACIVSEAVLHMAEQSGNHSAVKAVKAA